MDHFEKFVADHPYREEIEQIVGEIRVRLFHGRFDDAVQTLNRFKTLSKSKTTIESPVGDIFSVRTANVLSNAGYLTVGALVKADPLAILQLPNMSYVSLFECLVIVEPYVELGRDMIEWFKQMKQIAKRVSFPDSAINNFIRSQFVRDWLATRRSQ